MKDVDKRRSRPPAATVARAAVVLLTLALVGCGDDRPPNPSGTLEATTIDVAAVIPGRVLEVRADEGRRVAARDTLIVLDTEKARLELQRLQTRRRRLEAERGQARESLQQAERSLENARTTLARTEQLHEQGSATAQQVDDLQARRDIAVSQAQAALRRLEVIDAEQDELQASIALQESRIADGAVLAPRDGTVLLRLAEPGEVLRSGGLALQLADLDTLELRVFLQERDLDLVRLGEKLPVIVDALEGRELEGTVSWVSSEAEFTPKNVQTRDARAQLVYAVELRVPNAGDLHIGMPAEVRLPRDEDER